MPDPHDEPAESTQLAHGANSHVAPPNPSRESAHLRETDLLARTFWTVPETAFMCRVGPRTVWRLMADPKSKFPKPRRIRSRTLLARDEVLAFLAEGASR